MSQPYGRVHNFSAGPAVLPLEVVEALREELPNLAGSGCGLMEISHRSSTFQAVLDSAVARTRRVLALPEDHAVLLLQGGASLQFTMVPMNLLQGGTADYLDTGSWTSKAIKDARRYGTVNVPFSGKEEKYRRLPTGHGPSADAVYTWHCSNNTIYGTEYFHVPDGAGLTVCDMSSDVASRRIDGGRYDVIVAGAQKNLGPSGVTVVTLSPRALERCHEDLPPMLSFRVQVEQGSLYNTPNTLGIWVLDRVLRWIEDQGLDALEAANVAKAQALYDALDASEFWRPHADPAFRSRMNVTWRLADESLEPVIAKEAAAAGLSGIKGHRSVGGLRASLYNACPMDSVRTLVEFLKEFERRHG